MKSQRLLILLTVVNAIMLTVLLSRSAATAEQAAPVLRGRALEIVDERGKVRASIRVLPADPNVKMPDGSIGYPETVLMRLVNSKGAPNVKLGTTEDGSALVLGGEENPTHIQALARGATTFVKLTNGKGDVQVIKP